MSYNYYPSNKCCTPSHQTNPPYYGHYHQHCDTPAPVQCPPTALQLVNTEACPLHTRDQQLYTFLNNLSCPENALPVHPCKPRVTGTNASTRLDDAAPLVLAENSYRSITITNNGTGTGTVDGEDLIPGHSIHYEYPDHVDTPEITIVGVANPDELDIEYINYAV